MNTNKLHDHPMFVRVKYLVITELTVATLFAQMFVMRHQMSCCRFLCFSSGLTCDLLKNHRTPLQLCCFILRWSWNLLLEISRNMKFDKNMVEFRGKNFMKFCHKNNFAKFGAYKIKHVLYKSNYGPMCWSKNSQCPCPCLQYTQINVTSQIYNWAKKFKKWLKRPEWRINLFSLTALRLGLVCSYFLVTLLALLFFLFLTITRHPVNDRAEDITIFKD